MPGSIGNHFLMDTDATVLPSAFSFILPCVSLFFPFKIPSRNAPVVESWAKQKWYKKLDFINGKHWIIFIDVASSVIFNVNVSAERPKVFLSCSSLFYILLLSPGTRTVVIIRKKMNKEINRNPRCRAPICRIVSDLPLLKQMCFPCYLACCFWT